MPKPQIQEIGEVPLHYYSRQEWLKIFNYILSKVWLEGQNLFRFNPPLIKQKQMIIFIKDLFDIVMQVQKQHLKEKRRLQFANQIFELRQQSLDKVLISFNDVERKLTYTCNQSLQKISFKTIVSALTSQDQPIVRAFLKQKGSKEYHLIVRVAIQFLHQIQQTLVFKGQQMSKEVRQKLKRQNENKAKVRQMEREVIDLVGLCSETGKKVNSSSKTVEINMEVPFDTTIYSISLNFNKLNNNIVLVRFYYWDEVSKRRIENNQMPLQGIYALTHTQFSLIGYKTSFPKALLTIEGDFDSLSYHIKYQKSIKSQPIDVREIVRIVSFISVLSLFVYFIKGYFSSDEVQGEL